MIVYRDQRFRAESRPCFDQLRSSVERLDFHTPTAHDAAVDALILAGGLESAIADAIFPDADGVHPLTCALRGVSVGLGHVLWHSWHNTPMDAERWRSCVLTNLNDAEAHPVPTSLELSVPEGFAYYAVYPEAYLEAARRCHSGMGRFNAVCIGLRSIGGTLAAVVSAALEELGCAVRSFTVRPRGHPFSRQPRLTPALEQLLIQDPEARFLLIDEGPGISGSSLAGTAELLGRLGVADERIILLPSWETDGKQLRSAEAREHWQRHRQVTVSFEELWIDSGRLSRTLPGWRWRELSAGAWRHQLYQETDHYPAVQPQHERRKYLLERDSRQPSKAKLLSFFGLGSRTTPALRRAELLADTGFTPWPDGIVHGFLMRAFVPGSPVWPGTVDAELLETMARYLAHLSTAHMAEPSLPIASLREMAETNVAEGLGNAWQERLHRQVPSGIEGWSERPVALDGRMQAHEWIRTKAGYLKADAFDHHADHFFPGCQDIAWDIAGAAYELELDAEGRHCLIERYRRLSGDRTIGSRLPLYALYYLAYRLGYTRLARGVLGESPDGLRFATAADRYAQRLRQELSYGPGAYWNV
jgi:hypothetical protein